MPKSTTKVITLIYLAERDAMLWMQQFSCKKATRHLKHELMQEWSPCRVASPCFLSRSSRCTPTFSFLLTPHITHKSKPFSYSYPFKARLMHAAHIGMVRAKLSGIRFRRDESTMIHLIKRYKISANMINENINPRLFEQNF